MDKIKILIVEDEGIVAKDIQAMLKSLGYGVSGVASSGEECLKKTEETRPDLVLMDIMLKGKIDGVEAAKRIKNRFDIPVIYQTAYADENTLLRAKITEPYGYILKPFSERELKTTFEMAFYKYRMEKKLKERERWLSTVLKGIGDAVIALDKKGFVTFMNPVAEKLIGWKLDEAINKKLSDRAHILTDKRIPPHDKILGIKPFLIQSTNTRDCAELVCKSGARVPIDYDNAPLADEKGAFLGSVLIFRDISEKIKVEQKLKYTLIKLENILDGIIQAMALTVETRDPYTAGHQRRVSILACAIAEEIGLSDEKIMGIRRAAAIHDIGKICVPSEVLNKSGPLTRLEFNMIKTHPHIGYNILKTIEFSSPVAQIVLEHHERMNRSGYPLGLSGKRILLEARIIAVADVVEAMSSHRPYRPVLGIDKALEEISQKKGILYDSTVVDACLRLFSKKHLKFEELFKPVVPLW